MNEAKRYQTRQKREIWECLSEKGSDHFTAADIAARMHQRGSSVGLTTVYRCLDRMVEEGSLRRFILDNATAACYQRNLPQENGENCQHHYHLKCQQISKSEL